MDTPFTAAQWQPSKLLEEWDTSPSDSTVEAYIQCLNAQTTNIAAHPYDPNCWLDRAMTLVKLRYPELAVGDAHKAVMLCENLLTATEERPWFKFGYRTGFLMAETDDENEGEDTHERSRQRDLYTSLQERARTLIHENLDYSPTYKRGRVILQQYPWLHERHMMRSDDLIDGINRDLAEAARTVNTNPCCVVKRYAFGHGVGARDGEDLLGIFATRDISKGENILFDKSKVWHGIDIFASPAWDTHVFFTLKARVSNNAWTTPHSETINSLFSFFNHSCESNVEWQTRPDLRSMTMSATRDISAGEQLFPVFPEDGFVLENGLVDPHD
ncbi:hypothetical protein PRZ48_002071 [Zasmidium cellare]|uniref:SET domain-containing protein n=1 Tax=Zasmidium cellare TaxID=395010 RepID=A0ABR0F501_ZASCE|nr:hypothetical protein PRZ48_002071 [Zasmidium cellare]